MNDGDWHPPSELLADPNPGFLRRGLHLVYDLAWLIAIVVGSPWLLYKSLRSRPFGEMVKERVGFGLKAVPKPTKPRVLVHGVSVGEVKAALPVVRAIEAAYPELEIVLSTSTNTGREVARDLFPENLVLRFPGDPTFVVRRFLEAVQPSLVLLLELEVWPNFLRLCNRKSIPVAVVNGRITELSHGQYLLFRDVLPQFNRISLFCVQLEEYAERFRRLFVEEERLLVTGNVKVDGLPVGRVEADAELAPLLGSTGPVIVAGSTHEPEERMVADAWRSHAPEARLILVPRHPKRCDELTSDLEGHGFEVQRLTELRAGLAPNPKAIAIVDTIGELERVYGLADLVFVGGSLLSHGGHNMLEPAAKGIATIFGPHVANFQQEAQLLQLRGGCRQLSGPDELGPAFRDLLADASLRERMGGLAMQAVLDQRGATQKTLEALEKLSLKRIANRAASRI